MSEKALRPDIRFGQFDDDWKQRPFGDAFSERREKTTQEDEDTLLSCAITGMFLNSELFGHFRGSTTIGYLRVKKNDLILSAQNLHLGNANVNLRFDHGIISPAYKVYDIVDCDPAFVQAWVKKEDTKDFFLAATTEGASQCRKNIEWDVLDKQTISMPSGQEQENVGAFLSSLDRLILLEQKKLDDLKNTKSAMLVKMFPKEGESVPEVRFEGFSGEWEEARIGDIFDFNIPNNTLSRAELSYEEGIVLDVHYGDVLIKYGAVLDANDNGIPRILGKNPSDYESALLQDGDIIIADTAEDETAGKAVEISNAQNRSIVSGLHTMVCRPRLSFASGYLGYYLNAPAYHNQLLPLIQGTKVYSISKSNVQGTNVIFPSLVDEQAVIANYFSNLDSLITLHQRKLDKLKDTKKAMLNKMFCN